jgi:putative membrane protein insertion efficiency factor
VTEESFEPGRLARTVWDSFWSAVDLPFKLVSVGLIIGYRYSFSAFVGRHCRHLPTCSEFTQEAILKHGFWPGGWMGAARIWRCRPGGTHGYDPVPHQLPANAAWWKPWSYGHWR